MQSPATRETDEAMQCYQMLETTINMAYDECRVGSRGH
eukprot:SAG11_NODE_1088_length_5922_cov_2.451657_5_plen_38_part_00